MIVLILKKMSKIQYCSFEGHEEIVSNFYCGECKIYFCRKCENFHSKMFKNHKVFSLDKDINDLFTGYCKENNHLEKLEFFCKTHNKLCCSSCVVKIKREGKGEHSNCDICTIENIKDEKKGILTQNIKILEELSTNIDKSIKELKNIVQKIYEDKEQLKLKILKIFTEIRNKINEREDKILLEVDKLYDNTFIPNKKVKEIDKLPTKIKESLNKGKSSEKEWANQNNLNALINDCINIEKNILYINQTNQEIKRAKKEINTKIKFYPDNEKTINNILQNVLKFGELYIDKFSSVFEKDLLNIEINTLTEDDKIDDKEYFSFELNGFTPEKYNNFYPKDIKYEENSCVITLIFEGKDEISVNYILNNFIKTFKKNISETSELLTLSSRKHQNKLYIDLIRKIEENDKISLEDILMDILININEFLDISLILKNNFKISEFFNMNLKQFLFNLFSFIFKIDIRTKNLGKLLEYLEEKISGNILVGLLNLIIAINKSKFELKLSPQYLLEYIISKGEEEYLSGDIMVFKEELKTILKDINKKEKNILKYLKIEKFSMNILFTKYKSGFTFDINSFGLTNVVEELIFKNNIDDNDNDDNNDDNRDNFDIEPIEFNESK